MKLSDKLTIVEREYKSGCKEVVAGLLLQILILSCFLFMFSLMLDMFQLGNSYLKKIYKDGYTFELHGYSEEDKNEIEQMGFRYIEDSDAGLQGKLDSLDHILIWKANALIHGKDVWNSELDEYIVTFAVFQAILAIVGIGLLLVMLNNLSNALSMKLVHRQKFIDMLFLLGETKRGIYKIYSTYFGIRPIFACICAFLIYINICVLFNNYINENFGIQVGVSLIHWWGLVVLGITFKLLTRRAFRKVWKEKYETI